MLLRILAHVSAGKQGGSLVGSVFATVWSAAVLAQQPVESQRLESGARVTSLATLHDGKVLVGGGNDGSLMYWSREPGKPVCVAVVANAHQRPVTAVAASADGARAASACRGGVLRVWNTATRELVWASKRHTDAIEDACFTADGTLLTASHDRTVRWWNAANGDELRQVRHDAQVYSIALAVDGKTLFSGGDDPGLRIWRTADGALQRFVPAKGNQFFALAASPSGGLVAGGATLVVYAPNAVPGSARQLRDRSYHGWIQSVAFSPDGRRIVSGGDDGVVRVWDAGSGEERRKWTDHAGGVAAVLFVDGGTVIAAADDRGVLLHRH